MNLTFFKYRAFDTQGKIQVGQVNAESEREAIRVLKNRNLTPIKIGKSKFKQKQTKVIAENCPIIAIHLKITKVFLSKLRFSLSLKRVEKFI